MLGFAVPAVWGGPKLRKAWGVLGCILVQGVLLSTIGLKREIGWVLFIAVACGFELWQQVEVCGLFAEVCSLVQTC